MARYNEPNGGPALKHMDQAENQLVPVQVIERRIYLIRERQIMLSADLAQLYGVTTFNLNKAVKRNRERFPEDFMFQLSREEFAALRSQVVTLKSGRGQHPKYLPYAFTEQGVAMLSSVLRSNRAIQVNILIMRVFARLREILGAHKELASELAEVKRTQQEHGKNIAVIFEVLDKLLAPPPAPRRQIGFAPDAKPDN